MGHVVSNNADRSVSEELNCLLREIEFFLRMVDEEQQSLRHPGISSLESFRRRRMGTSAVGVCLALTEYVQTRAIWNLTLTGTGIAMR